MAASTPILKIGISNSVKRLLVTSYQRILGVDLVNPLMGLYYSTHVKAHVQAKKSPVWIFHLVHIVSLSLPYCVKDHSFVLTYKIEMQSLHQNEN